MTSFYCFFQDRQTKLSSWNQTMWEYERQQISHSIHVTSPFIIIGPFGHIKYRIEPYQVSYIVKYNVDHRIIYIKTIIQSVNGQGQGYGQALLWRYTETRPVADPRGGNERCLSVSHFPRFHGQNIRLASRLWVLCSPRDKSWIHLCRCFCSAN